MNIQDCNPFVRAAELQPTVLEGTCARMAYDHRLFYILEGNGELILEDRTISLSPDAVILLRPGVGYHFRGKMRVIVLNFDLDRKAAHKTTPICPPPVADFDEAQIFNAESLEMLAEPLLQNDAWAFKSDLLQIVRSFSANGNPLSDALCSALLKKLLTDLLFSMQCAASPTEALVERVQRYIHLYAAEITDNRTLGEEFGYHPVYLAQIFRTHTGKTLHRAILEARVELSCQWLSRTDHSIERIALDTGFSTRNHFCTVFRGITGITPRAYRERAILTKN